MFGLELPLGPLGFWTAIVAIYRFVSVENSRSRVFPQPEGDEVWICKLGRQGSIVVRFGWNFEVG